MKLVFLYGPPASGKLTIGRELAKLTGFGLFHNHLVVDTVASVFPFGTERFVKLREQFWLTVMSEAAEAGRSTIFTFAPEATVSAGFPDQARVAVRKSGGELDFVRLTLPVAEQERRVMEPSRSEFGKLRSLRLLRELHDQFTASEARMPDPVLTIDTSVVMPADAAGLIAQKLNLVAD